jgi:hypothetical protein
LGSQQKVLVIPEKIKDIDVTALDYRNFFGDLNGIWQSETLEKIFFPTSRLAVNKNTFDDCINLKKVIVINFDLSNGSGGGGTIDAAYGAGHFLFISKQTFDLCTFKNRDIFFKATNITYYCNYQTDKNLGVYWIDDVDYGEKIEFIPSNPVREGYEFGGWYKEGECINRWVFETDTLPEAQLEEVEVEATTYEKAKIEMRQIYQETKLYAKWIEK